MNENELIAEFMKISKCDRTADAISCLSAWNWDLKKALIDYNGNDSFSILIMFFYLVNF